LRACRDGNLELLHAQLTTANVNNTDIINGSTALIWVASRGYVECTLFLLGIGADVNIRDSHGRSALHIASLRGHVEVVKILLNSGALIDVPDNDGFTSLYWSIRQSRHNDFKNRFLIASRVLIDNGAKVSNVKLNVHIPAIPDWVNEFVSARLMCRHASIILIGIHKCHRTYITGSNDINVIRQVSKHIWASRMDNAWSIPIFELETK
jgi:ankyrin repeat protein